MELRLQNRDSENLLIERLNLPVMFLPVYRVDHDQFWTSALSITNDKLTDELNLHYGKGVPCSYKHLLALSELGFRSNLLLALAGVVSVAVGFASQISTSNFISGLFLLGEKSFKVGDVVAINNTRGEVISVDWLAIKLRTFDNLYVRIPNDDLIKGHLVNFSRHAIRRIDIQLWLHLDTDLPALEKLSENLIQHEADFLHDPKPEMFRLQIGVLGVQVQFSCWAERESFFSARSRLIDIMLPALKQAGVHITQSPAVTNTQDNSYKMPYP